MAVKRKLKITIFITVPLVIVSIIILTVLYGFHSISYDGKETGEVESIVTITRDQKGMPLVAARSANDIYFALGYLHAQDRLNIIEYLRAIATGKSDNYAGKDAELLNNLAITAGFTKDAADAAAKLKDSDIAALKSYVRGINHIIDKNRIRASGRPWRIEDVIAILLMKEWGNSYLNNRELLLNLPQAKLQSSKELFRENRYLYFYNEDDVKYLSILREIKDVVEKYICSFMRGNSISIASDLSAANKPLTSLSYEDYYDLYPGWYPIKFELNGKQSSAITYNGLPFFISFKSDTITLTQMNINADSQNFYFFDTEYRNSIPNYKAAGIWKEYKSIRIPIYNKNEILSEVKWVTEKGPVVSELSKTSLSNSQIMAMEFIHSCAEYIGLMLKIPFEAEIGKIRQSLLLNDTSVKCFIVSNDKVCYKIFSGLMNHAGFNNSVFIDGSAFIKPYPLKISITKQIAGLDYSGSDLVTDNDSQLLYNNSITNPFKIERFNSLLTRKKIYDEALLKNIITDNISTAAEKFTPFFNSILESNPLTSASLTRIYFNGWDYSANRKLQSPSIFYSTLTYYMTEFYKDEFGKDTNFNMKSSYLLFTDFFTQFIKSRAAKLNQDDPEMAKDNMIFLYNKAFLNAMRQLNRQEGPLMEDWKWGHINKRSYKINEEKIHLLSPFYKVKQTELSGGPDTIENLMLDEKLGAISSTSFQSVMSGNTLSFKMDTSYSTFMFSEFYYGEENLNEFQNLNVEDSLYTTIIEKK